MPGAGATRLGLALMLAAGCSLNPQPLPPDQPGADAGGALTVPTNGRDDAGHRADEDAGTSELGGGAGGDASNRGKGDGDGGTTGETPDGAAPPAPGLDGGDAASDASRDAPPSDAARRPDAPALDADSRDSTADAPHAIGWP